MCGRCEELLANLLWWTGDGVAMRGCGLRGAPGLCVKGACHLFNASPSSGWVSAACERVSGTVMGVQAWR